MQERNHEAARRDELVTPVERVLALTLKLRAEKTEAEQATLQSAVSARHSLSARALCRPIGSAGPPVCHMFRLDIPSVEQNICGVVLRCRRVFRFL
jgi:hypothetical protein